MRGSGVNGLLLRLFPPNFLRVQGSPSPLVAMCRSSGCYQRHKVEVMGSARKWIVDVMVMQRACVAGVTQVS